MRENADSARECAGRGGPGCPRHVQDLEPLSRLVEDLVGRASAGHPAAALVAPLEYSVAVQKGALEAIKSALAQAGGSGTGRRRDAPVTALDGARRAGPALREAVAACREELLVAQPVGRRPRGGWADLGPPGAGPQLRHGVAVRYLRGASPVGAADGQADDVRQALAAGAEVRVAGLLLERLVVCDRTIAFLPAHDEDCGPCLEVRHPALVRHLALAFDTAWRAARPVAAADGAPERPRDELRHAVLRMMVEGHTDEVIARRLGVSPRTVAAHVRREAVSLGSRSRAQLGYLLARSGMRLSP